MQTDPPDDTAIDEGLREWLARRVDIEAFGDPQERAVDRRASYPRLLDAIGAVLDLTAPWLYQGDPDVLDDRPMTAALDTAAAEIRAALHHLIRDEAP